MQGDAALTSYTGRELVTKLQLPTQTIADTVVFVLVICQVLLGKRLVHPVGVSVGIAICVPIGCLACGQGHGITGHRECLCKCLCLPTNLCHTGVRFQCTVCFTDVGGCYSTQAVLLHIHLPN